MRILNLELVSSSLPRQAEFYAQTLGLRGLEETGGRVVFQAGSSRLTFLAGAGPVQHRYHFAFNIPSSQFTEAADWLRRRVRLLSDSNGADEFHSNEWNSDGMYFLDPDGNVVELIARHTLPATGGSPFSGNSLLAISEIGIAAEDVPQQVEIIRHRRGEPIYDGAGSSTFTAVGDEHGLFIVVKRGRIWFPETGVAAEPVPIHVITEALDGPMEWNFNDQILLDE